MIKVLMMKTEMIPGDGVMVIMIRVMMKTMTMRSQT